MLSAGRWAPLARKKYMARRGQCTAPVKWRLISSSLLTQQQLPCAGGVVNYFGTPFWFVFLLFSAFFLRVFVPIWPTPGCTFFFVLRFALCLTSWKTRQGDDDMSQIQLWMPSIYAPPPPSGHPFPGSSSKEAFYFWAGREGRTEPFCRRCLVWLRTQVFFFAFFVFVFRHEMVGLSRIPSSLLMLRQTKRTPMLLITLASAH